jgi:hypothetical protein
VNMQALEYNLKVRTSANLGAYLRRFYIAGRCGVVNNATSMTICEINVKSV